MGGDLPTPQRHNCSRRFAPAYTKSLNKLPQLVAAAASRKWRESMAVSALAAIAVSKQFPESVEAILEMTHETVAQFPKWLDSR
jgi:hypothetical protein